MSMTVLSDELYLKGLEPEDLHIAMPLIETLSEKVQNTDLSRRHQETVEEDVKWFFRRINNVRVKMVLRMRAHAGHFAMNLVAHQLCDYPEQSELLAQWETIQAQVNEMRSLIVNRKVVVLQRESANRHTRVDRKETPYTRMLEEHLASRK